MGWLILLILAAAIWLILWRFRRFDRAQLQLLGAALLLAAAGYAWQGRPGLAGAPAPPPAREQRGDSDFAATREEMLGRFDSAAGWLTIADSYQRRGDSQAAAQIIQAGLRKNPRDADLWVGLGNALVIHGDGIMTPAAELAFNRAARLAPDHPDPKFFYGLALAQGGKLEEAGRMWSDLLESAPAAAEWRPMVEKRLAMLRQAGAMNSAQPLPLPR